MRLKLLCGAQVVDVAQGIIASLSEPASVGATYEFYGPTAYTMKYLFDFVGETVRTVIPIIYFCSVPL